jgi:hypothetical protein
MLPWCSKDAIFFRTLVGSQSRTCEECHKTLQKINATKTRRQVVVDSVNELRIDMSDQRGLVLVTN